MKVKNNIDNRSKYFLFVKHPEHFMPIVQSRIKLADQDILNILFHYYPEKLYELPCEWNYRVWLCSEVSMHEELVAKLANWWPSWLIGGQVG